MLFSSKTTITALISVILATSAFILVATNQQAFGAKINEEQAINILKSSNKTNHRILNGTVTTLTTDLQYVALNWTSYLNNTGAEPHSQIYVPATPVGESRPYWFIHIESSWYYGWSSGSGTYIVDAQSGDVMLSLESICGGVSAVGPDYLISFNPPAYDPGPPLSVKPGVLTPITLTLTAPSYYNASLPVSIRVTDVPLGYSIGPKNATAILTTGGSVSFALLVFQPVPHPADFLPPPTDPYPHFNVEISFLSHTDSHPIYIVSSNR